MFKHSFYHCIRDIDVFELSVCSRYRYVRVINISSTFRYLQRFLELFDISNISISKSSRYIKLEISKNNRDIERFEISKSSRYRQVRDIEKFEISKGSRYRYLRVVNMFKLKTFVLSMYSRYRCV